MKYGKSELKVGTVLVGLFLTVVLVLVVSALDALQVISKNASNILIVHIDEDK